MNDKFDYDYWTVGDYVDDDDLREYFEEAVYNHMKDKIINQP